jgi:hypothetical protein
MPAQITPPTARYPNYTELKPPTIDSIDDVDRALDEALPANPLNSTLSALKSLVRQFMSRRVNGLTFKADTYLVMVGVASSIDSNPQLANAELVRSITQTAMHDGELTIATTPIYDHDGNLAIAAGEGYIPKGKDPFPDGRKAAMRALGMIVNKRPDLVDTTLVKSVTSIAASDPDSGARAEAQNTLGKIAKNRPDLIDADMTKVVSQTATSPIADHKNGGSVRDTERLLGWQFDRVDNEARSTAQQTLQLIAEKRPDLLAAPKPPARPSVVP